MQNIHTVTAWDIVRRLAQVQAWDGPDSYAQLQDQAASLLAQVNTEAELRKALEASETARRELKTALGDLLKHCSMIHKHWGENCNQEQASAAIAKAQTIAQAGAAPCTCDANPESVDSCARHGRHAPR